MLNYLYVALGSAAGGLARFALGGWFQRRFGGAVPHAGVLPFPIGTLLVNVTGSFVLGAVLVAVSRQGAQGDPMRMLLAVGFCGGYTTFSTFSADTVGLMESGATGLAAVNVAASVALAMIAVVAGAFVARMALGRVA